MKQIKAVIFDMDGLMFDTETMYYKVNKEVADLIGMDFSYDYYSKYIGISDEEFHRNLYLDFNDDEKVTLFIKKTSERLIEVIERDGLIKKPGLLELLDYLAENQIKKVVASSNINSVVSFFLKRENLEGYFDYFIGGNEVKRAKPDAEIFEKAWSDLGVEKENTLILEDSLNGIRAAYDAQINVIMVPDIFEAGDEEIRKTLAIHKDLQQVKNFIHDTHALLTM
ncbi:HAD family hydrolase [Carnobacterium funditum]|uniref:HAD family hydrolase n=1 Tax=Carnobacterium funditum TaxID=2752 RepID=UPI0005507FA2|nr:HAD family phosphatase [Carnobacterium funditum]